MSGYGARPLPSALVLDPAGLRRAASGGESGDGRRRGRYNGLLLLAPRGREQRPVRRRERVDGSDDRMPPRVECLLDGELVGLLLRLLSERVRDGDLAIAERRIGPVIGRANSRDRLFESALQHRVRPGCAFIRGVMMPAKCS